VVLVADNPLKLGTANKPATTSPHAVECISLMKGSIKICTWNSGSQLLKIAFNPVLLFLGGFPDSEWQPATNFIIDPEMVICQMLIPKLPVCLMQTSDHITLLTLSFLSTILYTLKKPLVFLLSILTTLLHCHLSAIIYHLVTWPDS
jgi:hypothetical protein